MSLPISGPLSIGNIRGELDLSLGSLRTLSNNAGLAPPDSISEFYGYTKPTDVSFTIRPNFDSIILTAQFAESYSTSTSLRVGIEYNVRLIGSPSGELRGGFFSFFGINSSNLSATSPVNLEGDEEIYRIDSIVSYTFTFGSGSDLNVTSFNIINP